MVRIGELRPARGARRGVRRIGRGGPSGRGNTAGRGNKGQKARTGGQTRPGLEGGQLPLFKRVPYRRGAPGAGSVMVGGGPRLKTGVFTAGPLNVFPARPEGSP